MFLGIFDIDEYVSIPAPTHQFSSGAAYAPTSLTYSIYEEDGTTGLDENVDMTPASPFDSITGCYLSRRQLTAAAGFEVNKTYIVVVKATVDSVAAIDMHVFQVRAKAAIAGDAMTLTSAYDAAKDAAPSGAKMDIVDAPNNTALVALAAVVEAAIISEVDGELVLKAITDKIASVNPTLGELSLSAIASAVAAALLVTPANKINSDSDNAVKIQKMAVTLAAGDVSGNVPALVKAEDNIDFGALKKASITVAVPTAAQNADAVLEESLADHKGVANSLAKALFETNQRLNSAKVVIDTDAGTIKVYDTNGTDLLFTLTKTAAGNVYTIARS